MRTIAQFSIRDPDAEGSVGTAVPEEAMGRRGSAQSGRASLRRPPGTGASSLRHAESLSQMPVEEEAMPPLDHLRLHTQEPSQYDGAQDLGYPPAVAEDSRDDHTPTNENPQPLQLNTTLDYSPVELGTGDSDSPNLHFHARPISEQPAGDLSAFDFNPGFTPAAPPPRVHPPIAPAAGGGYARYGDASPVEVPRGLNGGGGLRVANRSSGDSEDWGAEALRQMDFGRG